MPTIGSSIIIGNFSSKGLTGLTGITGPAGSDGPSGITKGNTGSTGSWISQVSSDLAIDTIVFTTSSGSNYTFTGFIGATAEWSDSRGVSGQIGNTAFSPFKRVNGNTFEFYGLSAGINTTISLEGEQAVVRFTSTAGSYGVSAAAGYVPYISGNTLDSTQIYADSNGVLNFGLTGVPNNTPLVKPLFIDNKINTVNVVGMTLDLSKGVMFTYLGLNPGITAFINGSTLSNTRQEYFLLFAGQPKFLPNNLYFSNTETVGLKNGGFGVGQNLLHIWSDNGGLTFNASILIRGASNTTDKPAIFLWGSCCDSGNCQDNVLESSCPGGDSFKALTTCAQRKREASPGDPCFSSLSLTESAATSGVCCCGITGCIDSTNAPFQNDITIRDQGIDIDISMTDAAISTLAARRVTVTKTWCDKIGGVFKPLATSCSELDKTPGYFTTREDNTADGLICPVGCFTPVTCCLSIDGGYTFTQETSHYCTLMGGTPIVGKTVAELAAAGGCEGILQTGWCRRGGICAESTKAECDTPCGAHYTGTNAEALCNGGAIGDTPVLSLETSNPIINIVHSIDPANTETLITYGSNSTPTNPLAFTIINAPQTIKYSLGGVIRIKDVSVSPSEIDIWNSSDCLNVVVSSGGRILGPNDYISNNDSFTVSITSDLDECKTLFNGDVDFSADLVLYPISCIDGPRTDSSKTIPLNYTKSPCSCLVIGSAGNGITGDIINKYPVTIPFSATRYCTHCTEKQPVADIDGSGTTKILHIPYPLKTQTGFITFCPNTINRTAGSNACEFSTYWCIRYGEIQELSGCTYSSLFDADRNNLLYDGIETNVMPLANPPCFHAEYNEPGAGTTYWFSGNWDYLDINSPTSKSMNNLRPCRSECRAVVPTGVCALYPDPFDQAANRCGVGINKDVYTTCCRTCPGTPLFVSDSFAQIENPTACGSNGVDDGWICQDYQPYFNIVSLDKNVLNSVAKTYNINPYELQRTLQLKLQNYAQVSQTPGQNPVVVRASNLFNPLLQNNRTTEGPVLGTTALDPDELAKASCTNCADKFNKTAVIQVPYTNDEEFRNTTYDVYGIVIAKETTCTESGSYFSGKDGDNTCSRTRGECDRAPSLATPGGYGTCPETSTTLYEYKYYTVIIKDGTDCMNVFNIGSTNELYRETGDNSYLSGCGGGSILCDTDCGNGAILKQVKWFGTLTKDPTVFNPGFCNSSKKVNYQIKKDLTGYVRPGTGVIPLDDIIGFSDVSRDDLQQPTKLTNLGNMLKNIFGKERPQDYMDKICIPCTQEDELTSKNCSVNVIPELIEFIGKDCYLSGFDTTTGAFNSETIVYNNSSNANQITLFAGGVAKEVYWLPELAWADSSWGFDDDKTKWIFRNPTATQSLSNPWFSRWKYFNTPPNNTCGLSQNWVDNRWLKNHNVSYLEVKNGAIVKRKMIYESPEKTLKVYGLVLDGCSDAGKVIDPSSVGSSGWHHGKLFLDECGILPSGAINLNGCTAKLVSKDVPKIDINRFRPVTKIDYAKVYHYTNPDNPSETLFQIYIKYLSPLKYSRYARWAAMKLLYTDGTSIYDITSGFQETFGQTTAEPYIIRVGFDDNTQTIDQYFTKNFSGTAYINHSLDDPVPLDSSITVNIAGTNRSVTDLLKSGNVYVLVRETFFGEDIEKIVYSHYQDWERTGIVPKPVDGFTTFLDAFNPYGGNSSVDIVLEDYGLSRLLPVNEEAPSDPADAGEALTGSETDLRDKYIDGMCISIDCATTPDLCSDLGDC